jgi:hypothetical protein
VYFACFFTPFFSQTLQQITNRPIPDGLSHDLVLNKTNTTTVTKVGGKIGMVVVGPEDILDPKYVPQSCVGWQGFWAVGGAHGGE